MNRRVGTKAGKLATGFPRWVSTNQSPYAAIEGKVSGQNSVPVMSSEEQSSTGAAAFSKDIGELSQVQTKSDYGPETSERRQPIHEPLGVIGCIVIIAGTIVTIIVMSFLIVLWAGSGPLPGGKGASILWRTTMLNGWITQAITLSSVIIRIALALQASVCTSLVAALILENYGVPLSKVAHFTILRSVNGGPFTLVYLMSSIRSLPLPGTVISILFLGTLASQFASTILVSDLDIHSLVGFAHPENISFMMSESALDNFVDQFNWGDAPSYIPFGETPSKADPSPNEGGFSDTGILRRAFLPFNSNLTRLRNYAGPGMVMDSRVSCMRPSMEHQFTINPRVVDYYDGTQFISGTISYDTIFQQPNLGAPPVCTKDQCLPAAFNCSIPSSTYPDHAPPTFLCVPSLGDSSFIKALNSTIEKDSISATSLMMMVLTSDGNEDDWNAISNSSTQDFLSRGSDEWTVFQMGSDWSFNITLCFLTHAFQLSNVELDIGVDPKEPVTRWDIQKQSVDTTNILNFVGVDGSKSTLDERGIFTIEQVNQLASLNSKRNINVTLAKLNDVDMFEESLDNIITGKNNGDTTGNQTFFLCYDCDGYHDTFPSIEYRMLFADTLTTTKRPALAIQTLFGVGTQVMYYGKALWFDTFNETQIASSVLQKTPYRSNGLIAVMVIAAADLLCVVFITIWFLAKARFTKQGNYWQAIAQVSASEETKWILEEANSLTDREVLELVKGRDRKIRIARSLETGRVEVVRVMN